MSHDGERGRVIRAALLGACLATCFEADAAAQAAQPPTRTSLIEQAQAEKVVQPYEPGRAEKTLDYAENYLLSGRLTWHPFFHSAYSGGGFTLGAGYLKRVSAYNSVDMRGSITFSGYKRIEAEFLAPALFNRQARLSVLGGWREATEVGFYGFGNDSVEESRANYGFEQPYGSMSFEIRPSRSVLLLGAGLEVSQWQQTPGSGSAPSIETIYSPDSLRGRRGEADLRAFPGHRGNRLASGPGLREARRILRRDDPRLRGHGQPVRVFTG